MSFILLRSVPSIIYGLQLLKQAAFLISVNALSIPIYPLVRCVLSLYLRIRLIVVHLKHIFIALDIAPTFLLISLIGRQLVLSRAVENRHVILLLVDLVTLLLRQMSCVRIS